MCFLLVAVRQGLTMSPDWSGSHYINQAGLELRDPLLLYPRWWFKGLCQYSVFFSDHINLSYFRVCATTPGYDLFCFVFFFLLKDYRLLQSSK